MSSTYSKYLTPDSFLLTVIWGLKPRACNWCCSSPPLSAKLNPMRNITVFLSCSGSSSPKMPFFHSKFSASKEIGWDVRFSLPTLACAQLFIRFPMCVWQTQILVHQSVSIVCPTFPCASEALSLWNTVFLKETLFHLLSSPRSKICTNSKPSWKLEFCCQLCHAIKFDCHLEECGYEWNTNLWTNWLPKLFSFLLTLQKFSLPTSQECPLQQSLWIWTLLMEQTDLRHLLNHCTKPKKQTWLFLKSVSQLLLLHIHNQQSWLCLAIPTSWRPLLNQLKSAHRPTGQTEETGCPVVNSWLASTSLHHWKKQRKKSADRTDDNGLRPWQNKEQTWRRTYFSLCRTYSSSGSKMSAENVWSCWVGTPTSTSSSLLTKDTTWGSRGKSWKSIFHMKHTDTSSNQQNFNSNIFHLFQSHNKFEHPSSMKSRQRLTPKSQSHCLRHLRTSCCERSVFTHSLFVRLKNSQHLLLTFVQLCPKLWFSQWSRGDCASRGQSPRLHVQPKPCTDTTALTSQTVVRIFSRTHSPVCEL